MHHLRRDDSGVTLIEVLMAIVILSIIIVPLSNALIVVIRSTDDVNRRLNESHDVQIATAYFAQDVQSVGRRNWAGGSPFPLQQSIELGAAPGSTFYPCGVSGTPNAVVSLAWDSPQSATANPDVIVAAYVVQVAGSERQLRRITCNGATTTSTTILAHNLDPTVTPLAQCANPTTCSAAPGVPLVVTLAFSVKDPTSTGSALPVTLKGQRRQT
jgi:prepilin-type N-terminal cleavage/methylation domain-containing protein